MPDCSSSVIWTPWVWAFFATFLNFFLGHVRGHDHRRKTTRGRASGVHASPCRSPCRNSCPCWSYTPCSSRRERGRLGRMLQTARAGSLITAVYYECHVGPCHHPHHLINLWVSIPKAHHPYRYRHSAGAIRPTGTGPQRSTAAPTGGESSESPCRISSFVLTPYLITTFTGNVEQLQRDLPVVRRRSTPLGDSAGKTITVDHWLYKLTRRQTGLQHGCRHRHRGRHFVVLAVVSLITYRNSAPHTRNEEAFDEQQALRSRVENTAFARPESVASSATSQPICSGGTGGRSGSFRSCGCAGIVSANAAPYTSSFFPNGRSRTIGAVHRP